MLKAARLNIQLKKAISGLTMTRNKIRFLSNTASKSTRTGFRNKVSLPLSTGSFPMAAQPNLNQKAHYTLLQDTLV
jgi:hypothetical protein